MKKRFNEEQFIGILKEAEGAKWPQFNCNSQHGEDLLEWKEIQANGLRLALAKIGDDSFRYVNKSRVLADPHRF